ncbi:MAG: hypothetical protein HFG01_05155 [Oscillibacter sp.]|nr:hypothetical protein [Oscillibacter sp.]
MAVQYDPPLSALMDFFCEGSHQGFSGKALRRAEARLNILLPQVCRDFLCSYGKDPVCACVHQVPEPEAIRSSFELLEPALEARLPDREDEDGKTPLSRLRRLPRERWEELTENHVLLWRKGTPGGWSAGYRFRDLLEGVPDPPVYGCREEVCVTYEKWADHLEDFLRMMLFQEGCGWHGRRRFAWETNIQTELSAAGANWLTLRARSRPLAQKESGWLGACLSGDGETLYFYHLSSKGGQDLRIIQRRARPESPQDPAKRNGSDPIQRESHLPAPRVYRPVRQGPYRLALLAHQKKDLGMEQPKPEAGIPLHPFIALLVQEAFNHEPATAYDWGKDLGRLKNLKLELRYGTQRAIEGDLAYIYPPGEHFPPPPYYFDLEDWSIVEKMTALRSVLVDRILIEDAAFWSALKKLPNLKSLTVSATQVQDFSFLSGCRQLTRLSLYNTNFSDCRLLLELPRLQQADLRFCPLEHTEVLEQLACKVLFPN